ncbi:ubiquitin fusion degradation protein UFD1-domain-containing protein [Syncephalis plumigaleata]|nr:ubiquitin fusion degradation protein UFD1-domain-containing protein [Syncephalis plumigaleata]
MHHKFVPWSSSLRVQSISSDNNKGDRVVLPSSVLSQLLDKSHILEQSTNGNEQLHSTKDYYHDNQDSDDEDEDNNNHSELDRNTSVKKEEEDTATPLTFELRNEVTGQHTHAGVLEFSAEEGTIQLPAWMFQSLSIVEGDLITIQTKKLPKGTWAQFQPLSDQYRHIRDYRAAFEAYLRSSHTTLTAGETIAVPYVIDTDLTVVLEGPAQLIDSQEDQQQQHQGNTLADDSSGTVTDINTERNTTEAISLTEGVPIKDHLPVHGHKYYQIIWRKRTNISFDFLLNQVMVTPDLLHHTWSNWNGGNERALIIETSDPSFSVNDVYFVGVHTFGNDNPFVYTLLVDVEKSQAAEKDNDMNDSSASSIVGLNGDTEQCPRCHAMVPARSIQLHRTFVNGITFDVSNVHGDISLKEKHNWQVHQLHHCNCGEVYDSVVNLSQHRATDCVERIVCCRYCRNLLPRGKLAMEPHNRLMGLTEHEAYCGGRTIIVHMQLHDSERERRPPPFVRCRNDNCTRARVEHGVARNSLDLCETCFGPLWSSVDDPDRQKLVMRVARRYHIQLMDGCEKNWCRNQYCATGKGNQRLDATSAGNALVPLVLPLQALTKGRPLAEDTRFYFCVDETTSRRHLLLETLQEDTQLQSMMPLGLFVH